MFGHLFAGSPYVVFKQTGFADSTVTTLKPTCRTHSFTSTLNLLKLVFPSSSGRTAWSSCPRHIDYLNRMNAFCENQTHCGRAVLLSYLGEIFDQRVLYLYLVKNCQNFFHSSSKLFKKTNGREMEFKTSFCCLTDVSTLFCPFSVIIFYIATYSNHIETKI